MKKYIYYLIIFLFFFFPASCFAIVSPTKEFYINDYANILSSENEEYILKRSLALNEIDGTQIVVVTVPNLEGMSLEKYAYELFNSFGIGSENNNGLLLLLALEEREFRVEVGDGLGGILSDGKTGRFQDEYIIPYLKDNKWDEGIRNGYDAFYSEIVELNNLEVDYTKPISYYEENAEYVYNDDEAFFNQMLMFSSTVLAFLTGFSVRFAKKKNRKKLTYTYLGICGVIGIFSWLFWKVLLYGVFIYIVWFLIFAFANSHSSSRIYYGGRRGSSSSRSSFRGFSGGGGRSSGGGSSRRF
ncbi:MAG: TPM domain-containing protein [Bacilli bacterium]|nr:TPM domain-containing protein [Bacilli bacterium]